MGQTTFTLAHIILHTYLYKKVLCKFQILIQLKKELILTQNSAEHKGSKD